MGVKGVEVRVVFKSTPGFRGSAGGFHENSLVIQVGRNSLPLPCCVSSLQGTAIVNMYF